MTDKNRLLRAIGDIDDKYITEILAEDAKGSGKVVKVPFNQKPVIKYMKYYLPAAAALLIVIACVKSGVFTGLGSTSSGNGACDSAAAPSAIASEACDASETESSPNCAEVADEAFPMTDGMMETLGAAESDKESDENASTNYLGPNADVSIGMPNPFVECDTLAEAEAIAGFEFNIPENLDRRYKTVIRAIDGYLIEVIFFDGDREVYRIRKGTDPDVSGDYNEYPIFVTIDSDDWSGDLRGYEEGLVNCAVWTDGDGYGYSLTSGEEALETEKVCYIISRLMQK